MTVISWSPIVTRLAQRVEDALGDLLGLQRGDVVADDDELVAAEAGHRVAGPDRLGDPAGRVLQQVVADGCGPTSR